jgi:small GTP-binding protein
VTKKDVTLKRGNGSDVTVSMLIWDIMGQKGFRELLRESYFYGAEGALCVCDITNRDTLDELKYWIRSMESITGKIPVVFVGNKCDLVDKQVITRQELERFATAYGARAFLTSAKTGENVEGSFNTLASLVVSRK